MIAKPLKTSLNVIFYGDTIMTKLSLQLIRLRRAIGVWLTDIIIRNRHFINRRVFYREALSLYNYMFSPHQLAYLCNVLDRVGQVEGCFVEVGCAYGSTTAYLNMHLKHQGRTVDYIALDTFQGFVSNHADYEVSVRGKSSSLHHFFSINKKKWVQAGLDDCGFTKIRLEQTDCTTFDFDHLKPIAFALVDVDLYLPIRDILPKLYRNMAPGGIIVVDDCQPDTLWDGANQAYREFVEAHGLPVTIAADKLGIIIV